MCKSRGPWRWCPDQALVALPLDFLPVAWGVALDLVWTAALTTGLAAALFGELLVAFLAAAWGTALADAFLAAAFFTGALWAEAWTGAWAAAFLAGVSVLAVVG